MDNSREYQRYWWHREKPDKPSEYEGKFGEWTDNADALRFRIRMHAPRLQSNEDPASVEAERQRLEQEWRQVIVNALLIEVGNPATAERLADRVIAAIAGHITMYPPRGL